MIITGIFITSIFISIVKANWIVLHRSPLNVSADNIGNGSFSEMVVINNENFGTEENSLEQTTTTEAVNVDRFLENLSDVYNADQVLESTTEMSIDDSDKNDKRKFNDELEDDLDTTTLDQTEPPLTTLEITSTLPSTSQPTTTVKSTTTSQSSTEKPSTTLQSSSTTTTLAPSIPFPNPCLITDNEHCEITCSNTNSTELSNALIQLINGIDFMEHPDCPFIEIKLNLVNIRFSDSGLKISWLDNIGVNILELYIINPQSFTQILNYTFDSEEFSSMEVLLIDGDGSSTLSLESEDIFIGATNLKSVTITDFGRISFEPNTFAFLSMSLRNLEISRMSKPTNYFLNNLLILMKDSNLQNLESLSFNHQNFSAINLSKYIFEPSKDSIKSINLANSNVLNLTSDTFAGCKQLQKLHLENNLISELPSGLFDDLESLESLFLQNNQLTTITDNLFDTQVNFGKLKSIDLSDNPWFCDSNIFYLKNFLLHTTAEVAINNCSGPPSLDGIPINDLWCKIESCRISCEFTAKRELLAELEDLDTTNCTDVELHLKHHTFNEESLPEQWLSQLGFSISKLIIVHSNIKRIKSGTFNSPVFENLKEFIIDDNNETDLVIEEDGLFGLKSIEVLKIERSAGLSLNSEYSILQPIKDTLREISVSYILEPFNPRFMFEHSRLKNLKTLQLIGNNFEYIEFTSTTFEGIHENLEELFIVDSAVTNITADAFSGFKNLKTISLAGNDIESLDSEFFGSDPDKKLISVNLSNLKLKNLEIDTFNGCKQLQKLILSQNSIETLNAGIFDELESLQFLHLQDNLLTNIPENLFKTQLEGENLKLINFTNNPWNCDIGIIHLKQFLMNVKAEILIDGCSNPHLYGESIKDLWCKQEDCTLICQKTDESSLPVVLQIYDMPNCEEPFFHLISHTFTNRTIFNTSLSIFKFNVSKMHFEMTDIELIHNNAFKWPAFEKLQELKISHITQYNCYIYENGLSGLNSIRTIIFENLKELITFSSYSIFSPIQKTVRRIEINGIVGKINVSHLFNMPNFTDLLVLHFKGNLIQSEINSQTFRGAHKTLEEIYLSHTRDMTISTDAFSQFENLRIVDFAGSNLGSIDGQFFGNLAEKKLEIINLSKTNLETLGNDTFFECKLLKMLDLSNNSLTFLEPGTFDNLEGLESLHLQNNLLDSIPKNIFKIQQENENLAFVDLSGNPWICDASIINLKHFLETTKAEILINGCTEPQNLRDKSIKDLWCIRNSCTIECNGTDHHLILVLDYPYELNCEKVDLRLNDHKLYQLMLDSDFLPNLNYNIHKLYIENSAIERIMNNAFDSKVFEKLESFVITRSNNSCYIESNAFVGLYSIENLEINQFSRIQWHSLSNIFSPVRSTLKEVRLTNIKEDFNLGEIFDQIRFEKLMVLRLDGNDLKRLNESYFAGTHETLEELYLRSSKISKLNVNTFSGFKHLKIIDLRDNKLTTMASSHFGGLLNDETFKIFVFGNQWDCTCEIEFILDFIADDVNITCSTPKELAGSNIYELEESCYVPTTEEMTTITEEPTTTTEKLTEEPTTTTESKPATYSETIEPPTNPSFPPTNPPPPLNHSTTRPTTQAATTTTLPTTQSVTTTTISENITITTPIPEDNSTTTLTPEEIDTTTVSTEKPEATTPLPDTTTSERSTGSTTTPAKGFNTPSFITCFNPDIVESTSNTPLQYDFEKRYMPSNMEIQIDRPTYWFKSIQTKEGTHNEVSIEINDFPSGTILLYYPSNDDPFASDRDPDEKYSIRCLSVTKRTIFVKNLAPNVIYNFCLIINAPSYSTPEISPFQCRSYQIAVGKPWLYEEQKPVILTSLSLLIVMALIIGIILTYCLIRQIPTLIKGSKRVVLVNNRAKEVMILPRSSTQSSSQSISSSCRKESVTPIHHEPPTYLTPLPRQSFDHRPPFHRSSSDTSLKSYVSVSRLPPRFSQVYQRDDFDTACHKHHMNSYPYCPPTAPYQPVSDIPPPLPRRSIVSNSSSTQHSCASTAELGRTMSRAHNSTYRRHPRPIEIEQENHYNVII